MKVVPSQRVVRALLAIIVIAHPGSAASQDASAYPDKPVRIVVPYSPGGLADVLTRAMAQKMSEKWGGKPVLIENRPGAGGGVGAAIVAKSAPDGYALLVAEGGVLTINPSLYDSLPYDTLRDFAPVTILVSYGQVLLVHPSVPVSSLGELASHARTRPGALSYGSFGSGSAGHLNMESLRTMLGIDLTHVPYKGGEPAIADLLAGRIAFLFLSPAQSAPLLKAGKLKAIGISIPQRSAFLPDVPTFAEAGVPGFEATAWFGMVAPAGTPAPVVQKIHADVVGILTEPAFKEQWVTRRGMDAVGNTPAEFSAFMRSEIPRWARIVKATGAKQY